MGTLNKQYTFQDLTDIVAAHVNVNFDDIVAFINQQLVHADGTKPFTAVPVGPAADPTSANHLARKAYVDARDDAHRGEVNAAIAGANNAAAAAHGAANAARGVADDAWNRANNAQATANSKMAGDAVRAGILTGTTNGAGDIVITHNLGRPPGGYSVTPINGGT